MACGRDSGTGPKLAGPPASLTIISGDQQQGTVGTQLANPLVVKVVDANGNGVPGQTVNFHVTAGNGSVFAGASTTNGDGVAQERWTLGTVAGATQAVEARAVDNNTGQALVFGTFHATALADAAASITILTQPGGTASVGVALAPSPVVRLVDRYGNAVTQSGVTISVAAVPYDQYSVSGPTSVQTGSDGVATFPGLAVSGKAGSVSLSFSAPNLASATSAPIAISAGAAAKLQATTPLTLSGVVATRLPDSWVKVTDGFGNPVAGVTVTFTGSQGSNFRVGSMNTDQNGRAGFNWLLPNTVGSYTVTASVSDFAASPIVFTVTATAAAPSHITLVSGSGFKDTVGKSTPPLVVRVTDDFGNVASGATVNWRGTTNSGGGAPVPSAATSISGSDGTTEVTATLQTQTGANSSETAYIVASLANGASVNFALTAVAAPPASITKQSGDSQSAEIGSTLSPIVVRVSDKYGNPADASVQFAVVSGGGTVDPTSGQTSSGIVGVIWTLGPTPGTQQVTATVGTVSTTFGATALQYSLIIDQQPPTSAEPALLLSPAPVVQLVDANGLPLTRSGVVVAVSAPAPFALNGLSTLKTDGNGKASFNVSLSGPTGPVSLSFGGPGLMTVASNSIAVIQQRPMTLTWNYQSGSTQPVNSYLVDPMTLRVTDASNNPVPNSIVTFTVVAGGGTITTFDQYLVNSSQVTSAPQTTDANGQAMLRTWTLGPNAGPNVVRATVGNLSIDFTINGATH